MDCFSKCRIILYQLSLCEHCAVETMDFNAHFSYLIVKTAISIPLESTLETMGLQSGQTLSYSRKEIMTKQVDVPNSVTYINWRPIF